MTTQDDWSAFLLWETASRETVDFKTIYVDMADDLIAGLLLSQIVYWYLPGKDGRSKLRVCHDSYYWIAKSRGAWWDEIRITPKQVDRALKILVERGIIVTHIYKFNRAPTIHIRINEEGFLKAWNQALSDIAQRSISNSPKGQQPFSPNMQMDFTEREKSITETTTEITTEITDILQISEKPDLFDLARKTEQAQAREGNWADPAAAGGASAWTEEPVNAFCVFIAGINSRFLPDEERQQWGEQFSQIAQRWSTEERPITVQMMTAAIEAIPDSDIGWKTYTSPFAGNFATDIGPLLLDGGQKGKQREKSQKVPDDRPGRRPEQWRDPTPG